MNVAQIVFAFALILSPVVMPHVTHALSIDQYIDQCPQGYRCTGGTLEDIFRTVLTWALAIAFLVAVLVLVYGGFLYITSAGNQDTATKGKTAIINALIGIVVVVLSFLIVQVVYRFITSQ